MKPFLLILMLAILTCLLAACNKEEINEVPELEAIAFETTLAQLDSLDKGGRWLAQGVKDANELGSLSDGEEGVITHYLHDLALNPTLRCDTVINDSFLNDLTSQGYTTEAITIVERTLERVCSKLNYHEGYWVSTLDVPGNPFTVEAINDMHVDAATRRITVYAQLLVNGQIQSPAQVGPGEFMVINGDSVGFHPNAVYLNGSGEDLMEADGSGSWWVKHSWELEGEGYYNWQLGAMEVDYGEGLWVTGILLDDELTMKIGDLDRSHGGAFNLRRPVLGVENITYEIENYIANGPNEPAQINSFECREHQSAFDGLARYCPSVME